MGFLEQIRLHKVRAIKTLALVSAFIPYGIAAGIIGPALLDLGLLTDSTIDKVSYIFPARCAGSIFGSIIGEYCRCGFLFIQIKRHLVGFAYPHVNFQLMTAFTFLGMGSMHVLIPLSETYPMLIGCFVMSGIFYGFVGSGGNIHMLEVNISLDAFYL
jgi:hypothetical protein